MATVESKPAATETSAATAFRGLDRICGQSHDGRGIRRPAALPIREGLSL